MAGTQTEPTRVVVVTDAWAFPQSEVERTNAFQGLVGALRGAWGTGPWDAGLKGDGTWSKYQQYWDATCFVTFPGGSSTVTLPFKAKDTILVAYPAISGTSTPKAYYVQTGTIVSVDLAGPHVLKIHMSKVTK